MSFETLRQNLKNGALLAIDKAEETDNGKNPEIISNMRELIGAFCGDVSTCKPIPVYNPDTMNVILNTATKETLGNIYIYLGETTNVYTKGAYYLIEEVTE